MWSYGSIDYLVDERIATRRAEAELERVVAAARRGRQRRPLLERVIWWRPLPHPVPSPPPPARPLPV